MNGVQKDDENGRHAAALSGDRVIGTVRKSVTKRQPLLLNKRVETGQSTVVRVEKHLGERADLYRRVPTVLQAQSHRRVLYVH